MSFHNKDKSEFTIVFDFRPDSTSGGRSVRIELEADQKLDWVEQIKFSSVRSSYDDKRYAPEDMLIKYFYDIAEESGNYPEEGKRRDIDFGSREQWLEVGQYIKYKMIYHNFKSRIEIEGFSSQEKKGFFRLVAQRFINENKHRTSFESNEEREKAI